ncbi:SWIM zinc finger family protein [Halovenus halobia]|uniref:SWIM zinc finger family protein n=1 Tax=Halovenus halobia TaxID=3396622 RepID=UPI003F55B3E6
MDIDTETIQDRCTDAVFERGQTYREEERIRRISRFDTVVTAKVQGSNLYEVTVDFADSDLNVHCTCPYDGPGDCKHIVAVLLQVVSDGPRDESDRIDSILADLTKDELRSFLREILSRNPELCEQFLARFAETVDKSAPEYREEVAQLFDEHSQNHGVVLEAIDFSRFFDLAEQYQNQDRYRAAVAIYRGLFEAIDDNIQLVDAAYDHYARSFQTALDGYVESVQRTDPDPQEFESFASVLETRISSGADFHRDQFAQALENLGEK